MSTKTAYVSLIVFALGCVACATSPQAKEARFLKRGQALIAQKEYSRAILEFRNAVTAVPHDAEPYYQLGMAYLGSGDPASAAKSFERATTLNPRHSGAQLKLAELMTTARDPKYVQEAVSRLQGAFGDSPDNVEAIDTLALAEWKLGKPEDAIQRLQEALKKFPAHLQSAVTLAQLKLSKRDWNGAEQVLKKAVADAPESSAAATAMGDFYVLLRQPASAESEFKRAVQLDPKNGVALFSLGSLQIAARRMDEAEETYKRLAALPEKAFKPLHAIYLYQFGKREAALAEFEKLAKSDPDDRGAQTRLAAAYIGMNRVSDSEAVLAAALKRNPKNSDALLQRAAMRLRSGRPDEAERDVREVLHFNPDSAVAHSVLAEVDHAKGLQNSEQQELQQALRINSSLLRARLALGRKFLSGQQAKAALEVLDAAPDTQKMQLPWILGRNWTLLSLGNLAEARIGIEQALQAGRPLVAVYQNGVLQFMQKDYIGARAHLEEVLKSGVTEVQVVQLLMEVFAAQQQLAKGMDRLQQLAAEHPGSAPLQHLLGQWLNRVGNSAGARAAFEKAKAADPKFAAADLSLAEMEISEGRNAAALERLAPVVAADPKNVSALLVSARAQEAAGAHPAVLVSYRAVLDIEPSNLIALNNLAYFLATDSPDEALSFAQRAAEMVPDNPTVQDTLGWIYYRKGLYSMAVRYLKTAVDKETTPQRQFHLGMSYLKMGDQAAGQKIVRAALQKDPNLIKTEQGW
jgi:tetratricopeptide (TPR) repeat protein